MGTLWESALRRPTSQFDLLRARDCLPYVGFSKQEALEITVVRNRILETKRKGVPGLSQAAAWYSHRPLRPLPGVTVRPPVDN